MQEDEGLRALQAHLTVVRWHLDALRPDAGDGNQRHLAGARFAYERAAALLPGLSLLGRRRIRALEELAELGGRLNEPRLPLATSADDDQ